MVVCGIFHRILVYYVPVLLACLIQSRAARPLELPDNARADSELLYISPELAQMYLVEEFVDRREGSIKLVVSNVTSADKRGADEMSYFRIRENKGEEEREAQDNTKIIQFSKSTQLCNVDYLSTWYLWGLSHILGQIERAAAAAAPAAATHLNASSLKWDRTAIGPLALLRLVYDNLSLFRLDSRAFDKINLYEMYYFSMSLDLGGGGGGQGGGGEGPAQQQVAKFICTIPVHYVAAGGGGGGGEKGPSLEVGKSLLSELAGSVSGGHVSRVGFVTFDKRSTALADVDSMESARLLGDPAASDSPTYHTKLIVSYTLVQERSAARQVGAATTRQESVDFLHPFSLPAGAGCGLVSQHSPFYVSSGQFSGQFEALEFKDRFFVAYDQETNHLRYDSLGEHRTILALHDKRAIMISSSNGGGGGGGSTDRTNRTTITVPADEDDDYGDDEPDRNHCVQAYFSAHDAPAESYLFESRSLADILGLGAEAGLFYLGATKLRDDLFDDRLYHVFERELASGGHLPALARMHLRLEAKANNRYFANYYFVAERPAAGGGGKGGGDNGGADLGLNLEQPEAYRWLRLKRLEVSSVNRMLKYKLLNSRLTFSQFSWSLEGPDGGAAAASSVQMFDTLECKSAGDQLQLELVLQQLAESDWLGGASHQASGPQPRAPAYDYFGNDDQQTSDDESRAALQLADHQLEGVEAALVKFISRRSELARMFINELEMRPLIASGGEPEAGRHGQQLAEFLVSAKLTAPLDYKYTTKYLGWLKEADPVLASRRATLIKRQELMPRHECLLRLAARVNNMASRRRPGRRPRRVYMMYCPNLGCGHLRGAAANQSAGEAGGPQDGDGDDEPVVELESSSYLLKMDVYIHSCEVHELRREHDPIKTNLINNIYLPDQIAKSLRGARMSIKLSPDDDGGDEASGQSGHSGGGAGRSFRAIVSKLSLVSGLHHDYWDEQLMRGYCYTRDTRLVAGKAANSHDSDADSQLSPPLIGALQLERHHSRVHCHKACQLAAHCHTYTYDGATRECHLANIPAQLIRRLGAEHEASGVELGHIRASQDCALFALNPVLLYQPKDQVRFESPRRLLEGDKYLLEASLRDCASLCHSNELSQLTATNQLSTSSSSSSSNNNYGRNHCRAFKYLRPESLCSLEASNYNYYYGHEPGVELPVGPPANAEGSRYLDEQQLASLLEDPDRVYKIEWFQRNYEQYYELKRATRLELELELAGEAPAWWGLAAPVLYDVEQDVCLRECTVVRPECVAVDYCRLLDQHVGLSRSCRMYSVRSPFSVMAAGHQAAGRGRLVDKLEPEEIPRLEAGGLKLTELERRLYIKRAAADQLGELGELDAVANISIKHENCQHFYLAGDNLHLKRLLAASQNEQSANSEPLEASCGSDGRRHPSEQQREITTPSSSFEDQGALHSLLGFGAVGLWQLLAAGLALGSLAFISQPKLAGLVAAFNHEHDHQWRWGLTSCGGGAFATRCARVGQRIRRLAAAGLSPGTSGGASGGRGRARTGRSSSQVELNEMVDIGIYDSTTTS